MSTVEATMKAKVFHVITKLELGGAQKVTLMTLERLPRDRYELGLVTGPEGLLVDWANRIPNLRRVWNPWLVREVRPIKDMTGIIEAMAIVSARTSSNRSYPQHEGRNHRTLGCDTCRCTFSFSYGAWLRL